MRSQHPIAVLYVPLVLEHNRRPTAVFRVVVVLEHNRRTRGGRYEVDGVGMDNDPLDIVLVKEKVNAF